MTGLLLWIVVFIASYVAICILADAVVNSLIESSKIFSVSPVVLGLLVLGVDIEESMVSLVAVVAGLPYLSLGNLIGNTVIALGIAIGLPALFMTVHRADALILSHGLFIMRRVSGHLYGVSECTLAPWNDVHGSVFRPHGTDESS